MIERSPYRKGTGDILAKIPVLKQRGGKDLGMFKEDSLLDMDWLEHRRCVRK